ncbi:MAG TPA: phospholipid carrier-dependent glycosyltransferase [Gammaproteobacteria bacterium]
MSVAATKRSEYFAPLVLITLFAIVYVAPIGFRPLVSPDEVRYGEVAREMLVSGDWVSPRFNGVRYFEKPILGHWINALSLAAFGENEFAVRFPAALATGLTALIIFALTRRFVSGSSATWAAAIFLTTALVGAVGTFAVLDPFLSLCTTAAVAAWYLALHEPAVAKRARYLVACGVACGAAFLVKGFIGWAVPALAAGGYLVVRRQWRSLATLSWVPILVAILVAAPWAILIHEREPDFWNYFFWVEHVKRFAGDNAQHSRPFWFYIATLPGLAWPWTLAWPAGFLGLRSVLRRDSFLVFVLMWALLPLAFFSLAHGKLLTYILPCFPAFAILLAAGLEQHVSRSPQRVMRGATLALAGILALELAAILVAQAGGVGRPLYGASESLKATALCVLLGVGVCSSVVAFRSARSVTRLMALAIGGVAFILPLQVLLPERVLDVTAPTVAVARHAPSAETVVVADASRFGTVAWTLKRDDIYVVSSGEIGYGLSYPEARFRELTGRMLAALIETAGARADILIVCKPATVAAIGAMLPARAMRFQDGSTVFVEIPRAK